MNEKEKTSIDEAINNIAQVLMHGRIQMPNGPLTGQESQRLMNDLNLLAEKAREPKAAEPKMPDKKKDK